MKIYKTKRMKRWSARLAMERVWKHVIIAKETENKNARIVMGQVMKSVLSAMGAVNVSSAAGQDMPAVTQQAILIKSVVLIAMAVIAYSVTELVLKIAVTATLAVRQIVQSAMGKVKWNARVVSEQVCYNEVKSRAIAKHIVPEGYPHQLRGTPSVTGQVSTGCPLRCASGICDGGGNGDRRECRIKTRELAEAVVWSALEGRLV